MLKFAVKWGIIFFIGMYIYNTIGGDKVQAFVSDTKNSIKQAL